jgi:hypothetical protein
MKFQEPTPIQVKQLQKLMSRIVVGGPKTPIPKPKRSKPKTSGDSVPKRPLVRPTIIISPQNGPHAPATPGQEEFGEECEAPEDPIGQTAAVEQATRAVDLPDAGRVVTQNTSQASNKEPQEPTQLVKAFFRIFRSLRQQLFQIYGGKCETLIKKAEQQVRFMNPDFSLGDLQNETAPAILDLFEALVREASFLRRSRLREAALLLVADLYNKDYDLLDHHNLVDKVETAYYRLKK